MPAQPGLWTSLRPDEVYDRRFWHMKDYAAWQDEIWERPATGVVDVGPISQNTDDAAR